MQISLNVLGCMQIGKPMVLNSATKKLSHPGCPFLSLWKLCPLYFVRSLIAKIALFTEECSSDFDPHYRVASGLDVRQRMTQFLPDCLVQPGKSGSLGQILYPISPHHQ